MVKNDILVSVVIPIYNAQDYIEDCVNSVLSQTIKNIEILLIDDGSDDNSPSICDELSKKDGRVRTIHQKNNGASTARNIGIENSIGKYIAFLDADDWWDNSFLENMLAGYEHSDLCISKIKKVFSNGKFLSNKDYIYNKNDWCWPIKYNHSISHCRCMFLKEIIDRYNIIFTTDRKTGEDQEFTFKYMLHTNSISYIPQAEYNYRIHSNSCMFQKNYNHFDVVRAMQSVMEYAHTVCPEERYKMIADSMELYKYPYILEFAILTVLTAGEYPKKVYDFLVKNDFHTLLNNACKKEEHYESEFVRIWGVSPLWCLRYYWLRKRIGSILRKLKALRQ